MSVRPASDNSDSVVEQSTMDPPKSPAIYEGPNDDDVIVEETEKKTGDVAKKVIPTNEFPQKDKKS